MLAMNRVEATEPLGERIRRRREQLGRKRADVARAAGITTWALSKIESGETKDPKRETLRQLAAELRLPVEELLGAPGATVDDRTVEEQLFDLLATIAPPDVSIEELRSFVLDAAFMSPEARAHLIAQARMLREWSEIKRKEGEAC